MPLKPNKRNSEKSKLFLMTNIYKSVDIVENIPNPLYKYYSFHEERDPSRLNGCIYFSSPLDFNDPYDCQTDVCNNTLNILNKGGVYSMEWLRGKLIELGFPDEDVDDLAIGLRDGNIEIANQVHLRQIEKLGVLCLTNTDTSITMWAYYTNHKGYCLQYDTTDIMRDITLNFVEQMDLQLLTHLWNAKKYNLSPQIRCSQRPNRCMEAARLFKDTSILSSISNKFFERKKPEEILYFVQNVYIKRCWANRVQYVERLNMQKPNLFFDESSGIGAGKYNHKLNVWSGEKEYRIGLSLGGRKLIRINPARIKRIIFGYNSPYVSITSILKLISENIKPQIYKIDKGATGFITSPLNIFNESVQ